MEHFFSTSGLSEYEDLGCQYIVPMAPGAINVTMSCAIPDGAPRKVRRMT